MWTHIHTNTSAQAHVKSHRLLPTHVCTHSYQHTYKWIHNALVNTHMQTQHICMPPHTHELVYTASIHICTHKSCRYVHAHSCQHTLHMHVDSHMLLLTHMCKWICTHIHWTEGIPCVKIEILKGYSCCGNLL